MSSSAQAAEALRPTDDPADRVEMGLNTLIPENANNVPAF